MLAIAVLGVCLLPPAPASAADGSFGQTVRRVADGTFDVLILRTTGLAVLGVGVVLFVPSAAVTWPGGMNPIREAWERFVVTPTEYAITRPIGDF